MLNFREKTIWIHVSTQDVTLSLMGDLDLRHPKFNALRFVYLWLTLGLHLPRGCRFWMKAWASFHTLFNGFWVLKAPKGVPKSFFLTSTVTYTYLLAYVLVETCLLNKLITCLLAGHVLTLDTSFRPTWTPSWTWQDSAARCEKGTPRRRSMRAPWPSLTAQARDSNGYEKTLKTS